MKDKVWYVELGKAREFEGEYIKGYLSRKIYWDEHFTCFRQI
jgi:hypothetical protein